jgi:hypothetical protein
MLGRKFRFGLLVTGAIGVAMTDARAGDMIPLEQIFQDSTPETSLEDRLHVIKRCSAASHRMFEMGTRLGDENAKTFWEEYDYFLKFAVDLQKSIDEGRISFESIDRDIKDMSNHYQKLLRHSYDRDGVYSSELFKKDMKFCHGVYKALNGQAS